MKLRPATPADEPFLSRMVALASDWGQEHPDEGRVLTAREQRYVMGFGRPGDLGVVAERHAAPVGAAWLRRFTEDAPGHGFVAEEVPELSIAVVPGERGRGVGGALLAALLDAAGSQDVSLSVEAGNPARRLYERSGFRPVREDAGAVTMLRARLP